MFNDGKIACNSLGVSYVDDELPKRTVNKVNKKINEIIEKYDNMAKKELDDFLESLGLECAMGIIIKKEQG